MKQTEARRAGTTADTRPAMAAEGAKVRLDDDTMGRVVDAARRQKTDPKVFMAEAVRAALGDRDDREAQITVGGFRHSGDGGRVSLGMPTTRVLKRAAREREQTLNELVRGAISTAADKVRQRDEMERQAAGAAGAAGDGMALPAFDPAGILESLTGGAVRDPIVAALQSLDSGRSGAAGGRRVR